MDQELDLISKNTRNERIINFFKKNYKILILFISLIVIAIILFFGFEYLDKKKNLKLSNKYNNIVSEYEALDKNFVINELKNIIEEKNKTYSPLSLFFLIDNDLITSKKKINQYFDLIINDVHLEKEIKNLIIYKKALYNADDISEGQLISILNPIINSNSIWKSHSLYILAEFFFSKAEKRKAKEYFQKILVTENANEQLILEAQKRLKRDLGE
tara:strand:+ start:77 stop:721 length:645 start_codon:yes stop_codon:yes gene_type:complete